MFLVVGLGNPGERYAYAPHNLGFMVVDRLAQEHSIRVNRKDSQALVGVGEIAGKPVMLAKPQTFMNLSGVSVRSLMEKHEFTPQDLVVVYDELDLPWTALRIRPKGSCAGHNGGEDGGFRGMRSCGERRDRLILRGCRAPLSDYDGYS